MARGSRSAMVAEAVLHTTCHADQHVDVALSGALESLIPITNVNSINMEGFMPKHELMMWLIAGGGTLAGSTITFLATRRAPQSIIFPARSLGRAIARGSGAFMAMSRNAVSNFRAPAESSRGSDQNRAFEEYRTSEIERLEQEQRAFAEYLQRLRDVRDRQEFEDYLASRKTEPLTINN